MLQGLRTIQDSVVSFIYQLQATTKVSSNPKWLIYLKWCKNYSANSEVSHHRPREKLFIASDIRVCSKNIKKNRHTSQQKS